METDTESLILDAHLPASRRHSLRSRVLAFVALLGGCLVAVVVMSHTRSHGRLTSELISLVTIDDAEESDLDSCYKRGMYYALPIMMPGSKRTVEANHKDCQARCAALQGCSHFTFWPNGGCLLTEAGSTLEPAHVKYSATIVGPKICADSIPTLDPSIDAPQFVTPSPDGVIPYVSPESFIPEVDPSLVKVLSGNHGSHCSAYPACVNASMEGNCCPNDEGVSLGCCNHQAIVKAGADCAAFPSCVAANLTVGACCPTADGVRLDCCDA